MFLQLGLLRVALLAFCLVAPNLCLAQYEFGPSLRLEPDTLYSQRNPSFAIDCDGNPYVVWVTWKPEIRFAKSTDGGETFCPSVSVDTSWWPIAWPRIALDHENNPHVTWTEHDLESGLHQVRYARSTDRGESFLSTFFVEPDTTREQSAGSIVVDKDGNPMIVWHASDHASQDNVNTDVYFARSFDGGLSFKPSILVDPHPGYQVCPHIALDDHQNIYVLYLGDHWGCYEYVFMVRSTDGGQTFSERVWVDRDLGCSTTSSIATAPASQGSLAQQNSIMIVWDEKRDTGSVGLYFSKSTDRGETFGDVITVSERPAGLYSFSSLATDSLGNPIVVWDTGALIRFSYSTDAGLTFAPAAPVDSAYWSYQDRPGIAMSRSGAPMVVWADDRPPHRPEWQIYFAKGAKVGLQESNVSVKLTRPFPPLENYPNPFSNRTVIKYHVPRKMFVTLTIYDILGRPIRTLAAGVHATGEHTASWDGTADEGRRLPCGIYFSKLTAGSRVWFAKIVLLR